MFFRDIAQSTRRDHNCSQQLHRWRAFGMQVAAIARLVLRVLSRPMYCPNNTARQLLSALSVSFAVNKISFERGTSPSPFAVGETFARKETWGYLYVQTAVNIRCLHRVVNEKRNDSRYLYVVPELITPGVREKQRVKGEKGRDWGRKPI